MARVLGTVLLLATALASGLGGSAFAGPHDDPCPEEHNFDSSDAMIILQYEAGLIDVADWDIDQDGSVNSVDALWVLWITAGTGGQPVFGCVHD